MIRHYSRKRKAKKSRETRKKTQPVPADLFQQLSQMEEGGREGEKVKQEVERERKQFVEQLTSAAQDSAVSQHLCCVIERWKHNSVTDSLLYADILWPCLWHWSC